MNAHIGLTSKQVAELIKQRKTNVQPEDNSKSLSEIIFSNILTPFNFFNVIIAGCLFFVGEYKNCLFMLIIIINTVIGIIQELRSKRLIEKLSLIASPKAVVIREGNNASINVQEVVLGDLICLELGNQICTDSIVIDGEIEVNESLLTGESDSIPKRSGDKLLSGSFVASGSCVVKAEHVGVDNYSYKIISAVKKRKKSNSLLMHSLDSIVRVSTFFLFPFGSLLFLSAYYHFDLALSESVVKTSGAILGMLPKGLVLLTTMSLAVGVYKLAKKNTLVQDLYCIENLSRVDMLCIDKTGTLTEGKMSVTDIIQVDKSFSPLDISTFLFYSKDNNATFLGLQEHFGNQHLDYQVEDRISFSSERKWSYIKFNKISYVLGAYDILLSSSTLSPPAKITEQAENGSRVLLFASVTDMVNGHFKGLTPLVYILLEDKVRSDAKQTLEFFREQGVAVKVISGDNPITVSNIAKRAGIDNYASYIDATTLKTDEQLVAASKDYSVFGRVSPIQKRQLVNALKAQGHTVAMTGDGVNDLLALREADCSIAMASGSDAVKQVAQLVLLNSTFSSLPNVVMEGRRVVNNITIAAKLFLVKTVFSFLLAFATLVFGVAYPFNPIQLSLLGGIIEGIPAFLLTFEPRKERVEGHFLYNVLRSAIPCAMVITVNIILVFKLGKLFSFTSAEITSLHFQLTGLVWLLQLLLAVMPLNRYRFGVWASMCALFYLSSYVLQDLLDVTYMSFRTLPLYLILAAASLPMFALFVLIIKKIVMKRRKDIS